MNKTASIYEIEHRHIDAVTENMKEMKIIMVKGLGYVVVSKEQETPAMFRKMGEVVAQCFEHECVINDSLKCPHEKISGKHCTYCKIPD